MTAARDTRRKAQDLPDLKAIEGRIPPADVEAEGAVISACLLDETGVAFDKAAAVMKPEDCYSERHRRIFEAAVDLRANGQPIDIVTVASWLKERERLDQVGGYPYLTELLNAAPFIANVEAYAVKVRERARERKMIATCQRAFAQGYIEHGETQGWLATVAEDVHRIAYDELSQSRTLKVNRALQESIKKIQAARGKNGVVGCPTGLTRLDKVTGGLHASDLTIVAARPGAGKTSLVLNIAANAAAWDKGDEIAGVVIFSLEMPRDQCANRMAFAEAKVDVSKARTGDLSPEEWRRLTQAATHLGPLPIWIDDTPAITLGDLRALVRARQAEFNKPAEDGKRPRRLAVVIVDYLQLMTATGAHGSRDQEIGELTRGLKRLAKDCGVSVIALSQLNRSLEQRADKRPQLSDLRESGNIEQDADNIIFIYRDEYYNKQTTEKNVAELIIAKQRNGPTGFVKVRFDSEYTRFDNLADEWGGSDYDA